MATGAEHYLEAEAILRSESLPWENDDRNLAAAQVHATLALAAAVAHHAEGVGVLIHGYGEEGR